MQKIALYISYTEEGKSVSLTPPPSLTQCEVNYQLIPDSGKILKNIKTGQTSRGLIVPSWKESLWEEVDI